MWGERTRATQMWSLPLRLPYSYCHLGGMGWGRPSGRLGAGKGQKQAHATSPPFAAAGRGAQRDADRTRAEDAGGRPANAPGRPHDACMRHGSPAPRRQHRPAPHRPLCGPQVQPAVSSSFFTGSRVKLQCFSTRPVRPTLAAVRAAAAAETEERYRLNNLSPQPGSRKSKNRKGRGYGAGQVRGGPASAHGAGSLWPTARGAARACGSTSVRAQLLQNGSPAHWAAHLAARCRLELGGAAGMPTCVRRAAAAAPGPGGHWACAALPRRP